MTRCVRFLCCAVGAAVAVTAAGCGSMSRMLGGRSSSSNRTSAQIPNALGSYIASVDVQRGSITFQPDKAKTAGKARIAAQQYGPGDRLQLAGTASLAAGVLTGNVTLTSNNTIPLNDARVVVTSISDNSVTVANADGETNLGGSRLSHWDHITLDPGVATTKAWKFNNPGGINFTFRVTILANIWSYSLGDSAPNISISFPTPQHGWMVGVGGKLLYTTDAGATWKPQNAGTAAQLEGVYFVNQFDGWIVGTAGTIRRTNDGGRTWMVQTGAGTTALHAVKFVSPTTGWIVGDNGLILKTVDSGATWTTQSSSGGKLYGVDFADANVGWAVGENATILKTVDGGASWSLQSAPSSGGGLDTLLTVAVRSATQAWIGGASSRILRTTNGFTWTATNTSIGGAVQNIFFLNNTTGWAVGGSGSILKSTDGGATWSFKNSGTNSGLFFVRFADPNNGWAVGQTGTLLRSTNGGETWTRRAEGIPSTSHAVDFPSTSRGWLVGDHGVIRATTDGGQSWTIQATGSQPLHGVKFVDNQNGWAVGGGGTILRTTNGGATWTSQASGTTALLLGVDFIDAQHGCVVGAPTSGSSTILYTNNGGASWQPMLSPSAAILSSVDMVDQDLIYAAGSVGTILVTFEGSLGSGASWDRQFHPYGDNLHVIRMVDANNGWAVGQNGRILRTVNGGGIWDTQRYEPLHHLYGADFQAIPLATPTNEPQRYKYVGWAVGENGKVLRTTNGGATWTQVDTGTLSTLRAFRYVQNDPDSAWAVGASGTVQQFN